MTLLIMSTLAYALNGVVEYLLIRKASLAAFFFLWSIGTLIIVPFVLKKRNPGSSSISLRRGSALPVLGALLIIGFNLSLFIALRRFMLAEVYPLIALSSLVFFFMDLAVFRSLIKGRLAALVLGGIATVIGGVYVSGGAGFSDYNISLLPFVIAIPVLTGLGYYMLSFNLTDFGPHLKSGLIAGLSFAISFAYFALDGTKLPSFEISLLIILSGALYIIAVHLELLSLRLNEQLKKERNVAMKNYINNFTYMDTVLVLVGSIAIGSYTIAQIVGGFLIVAGVVIISRGRTK